MKKLFVLTVAAAFASAVCATTASDAEDDIPRTPSGKPDFSGTYDIKTMTPMDRPRRFGDNQFMSREEAERISKAVKDGNQANDNRVLNAEREAPPDGGDGSREPRKRRRVQGSGSTRRRTVNSTGQFRTRSCITQLWSAPVTPEHMSIAQFRVFLQTKASLVVGAAKRPSGRPRSAVQATAVAGIWSTGGHRCSLSTQRKAVVHLRHLADLIEWFTRSLHPMGGEHCRDVRRRV